MKKIFIMFTMFISSFFLLNTVNAEMDLSYRATRDNKPIVKVGSANLYVTTSILANMDGAFSDTRLPVAGISAKWENGTLYVTVKRSEINKVLKANKFENVYSLLEVNADYLDINKSNNYYYFKQLGPDVSEYNLYFPHQETNYLKFNFIEVYSGSLPLVGLMSKEQSSIGGGLILYESAQPTTFTDDKKYQKADIVTEDKKILEIDKSRIVVSLIEDEQINLGDNTTIIDSSGTVNQETGAIEHGTVDINNFYGEYFENNKLKYSWTMYDVNGNPVQLDINTSIVMDNSTNESTILSNFSQEIPDIKDRIKIISFEHEGELGGTAKVSLYVGDKFKSGEILTLYYYNPESGELEDMEQPELGTDSEETNPDETPETEEPNAKEYQVLVDEEGYITIELTHCSEYVLTPSDVKPIEKETSSNVDNKKEDKKENNNLPIIIGGVIGTIVVIGVVAVVIIKKKKQKVTPKQEEKTKSTNDTKKEEKEKNFQ